MRKQTTASFMSVGSLLLPLASAPSAAIVAARELHAAQGEPLSAHEHDVAVAASSPDTPQPRRALASIALFACRETSSLTFQIAIADAWQYVAASSGCSPSTTWMLANLV